MGRPRPGLRKGTLQGSGAEGTVWKPASPQQSWLHVSLGYRADEQLKNVPSYRDRFLCCLLHVSSVAQVLPWRQHWQIPLAGKVPFSPQNLVDNRFGFVSHARLYCCSASVPRASLSSSQLPESCGFPRDFLLGFGLLYFSQPFSVCIFLL